MKEYQKSKLNRIKRGQIRATYDVNRINKILDAGFIGFVNYNYNDTPISIPMGYGRDGDKIYLHGSQANRMMNALLETGKISMTVMHLDALVLARSGLHHSVNYRSATLFGSIRNIENEHEKEKGLKCFMDHMMPGRWEGIRAMHKEELDRTMVLEMTIETASAKIRDVGVNDEPEDYNLDVWAGIVPLKQIALHPLPDDQLKEGISIPEHVMQYFEVNQ